MSTYWTASKRLAEVILLDVILPGVTFQLTPEGAEVFWVLFFGVVIALVAIGDRR